MPWTVVPPGPVRVVTVNRVLNPVSDRSHGSLRHVRQPESAEQDAHHQQHNQLFHTGNLFLLRTILFETWQE